MNVSLPSMLAAAALVSLFSGALAGGSVAFGLRQPDHASYAKADIQPNVDEAIGAYIKAHPEQILASLRSGQAAAATEKVAATETAIKEHREALFDVRTAPSIGAGDPDVTIVEFFDFRCPYCKSSVAALEHLTDTDPKVRVIFRDIPVLGELSDYESRLALAAARQGRYHDAYRALFGIVGTIDKGSIQAALSKVGLDVAELERDAGTTEIRDQVKHNLELANQVYVTGTPAWIVNDQSAPGALDQARLAQLVSKARAKS
ncbi:MAG TPA: DsbA family protein [Rhizomicrobium sp.]|nr:DsbA family protein [Rhizomicrobium sp.]